MKKNKLAILLTALVSLSTSVYSFDNLSSFAINSNFDIDTDKLHYFNLNNELVNIGQKSNSSIPSYNNIKQKVLEEGSIFLFDFSDINNPIKIEKTKDLFRKVIPLSFDDKAMLVSRYNGKLMLSPINTDQPEEFIEVLHRIEQLSDQDNSVLTDNDNFSSQREFGQHVPMIEYYVRLNNTNIIQNSNCSVSWDNDSISTCSDKKIDLLFLVSLASSEGYSNSDKARFVRVSFGNEAQGLGVTLNNQDINTIRSKNVYSKTEFMSAPLIEKATFSVKSKARIFNSAPENINPEGTINTGNEMTYNATLSLKPKEPMLTASVTSKQSRNISITSKEYAISKKLNSDNIGNSEAIFSWDRRLFNTAQDNMKWYGNQSALNTKDPLVYDNISVMSYRNFMPVFDITFVNEEKGKTDTGSFNIEASITPKVFKAYGDVLCSLAVCHTKFRGESVSLPELKVATSFTVDWDNPVFIGQWPVNLQLGGLSSKCTEIIETSNKPDFSFETCDIYENKKQGFFIDKFGRLQSVSSLGYCLERASDDINKKDVSMGLCNDNMKLEQHWVWKDEKLINQLYKEQAFVNIDSNEVILANEEPQGSYPISFSRFLELFTPM